MGGSTDSNGKIAVLPDIAGLYGFITFAMLVVFDSGKALIDGDTLWHITAGRRMLSDGAILTRDVFSHTAANKPWTAHEWLSEIIMAWFHQHTGLIGTTLFFFLVAALSFWLLFRIVAAQTGDWIAIFAVSVAVTFSMTHLLARPHVFSWLFGVVTLYILHRQGRWLWLLPPLTALWANLHGGFILGLALQGLFIGGTVLDRWLSKTSSALENIFREIKRPAVCFGLSILAAAINPFGFRLFLFPFQVTSGLFSSGINEWLPPNLQEEWFFRLFLLVILLLMSLPRTPITWTDRLFALFFLNAAMTHQRYIGMAAVFLSPWLGRSLRARFPRRRRPAEKPEQSEQLPTSPISGPVATVAVALALMLLAAPGQPRTRAILETFLPLPESNHPIEAVKYLNETRPAGNMFNKYGWGGYLIYALQPPEKVFIDGRADMYGEEIFGDYQKIVTVDEEAENLLDQYNIDWILFSADSALVRYLKATGKWRETYLDETASVLVRLTDRSP